MPGRSECQREELHRVATLHSPAATKAPARKTL
jgi:hypothetical protein